MPKPKPKKRSVITGPRGMLRGPPTVGPREKRRKRQDHGKSRKIEIYGDNVRVSED